MEQKLNALLKVSADLYELLSTIPEGTERDTLIFEIDEMIEERGELMDSLLEDNFQYDESNKLHETLLELDQGIRTRLTLHLNSIKSDLRDIQLTKQTEKNYSNPYADVRVMDGKYYDTKK